MQKELEDSKVSAQNEEEKESKPEVEAVVLK